MNPIEHILRANEQPSSWFFVRAWIPARTSRYSWKRVLLSSLAHASVFIPLVWALSYAFALIMERGNSGIMVQIARWLFFPEAEAMAIWVVWWFVISRFCWNRRAAGLMASKGEPEFTPLAPRRNLWLAKLLGPPLTLFIVMILPWMIFYAIEDIRGAWAWNRMESRLRASGVCYQLNCIVPPPAKDGPTACEVDVR